MTVHLQKDSADNVDFAKILKEATLVARHAEIFHSVIQIEEETQLKRDHENYIDCSSDLH